MSPEAWVGVAALITTISLAIIGSNVAVWVRIGKVTEGVRILTKQLEKDQDEHLRMWKLLDMLPRVTTQTEGLIQRVDALIKSDRERLSGCAEHATRLKNFENRLGEFARRSE